MAKRSVILIAFLVIISLSLVLASCQPLPEKKPSFAVVLNRYSQAKQKQASAVINLDCEIDFVLNLPGLANGSHCINFSQVGELDRTVADKKIAFDFNAYTSNSDMGFIVDALRLKKLGDLADIIDAYFKKKNTKASLLLGYDGLDTYNIKAGYYKKDEEMKHQAFYAINEDTISSYQSALALLSKQKIIPKDILMINDFYGIATNPEYLIKDEASTRYDVQKQAFLYSFILNNDGLQEYLFQVFENKLLSYLVNEQNPQAQESYDFIKDSIRGWFTIERTSMKAIANSDLQLTNLESGIKLKITVPNRDVKHIANMLVPDSGNEVADFISDIKINIDISIDEQYSYADDISLASYTEQNLFASSTADIEGRVVINIEDLVDLVDLIDLDLIETE